MVYSSVITHATNICFRPQHGYRFIILEHQYTCRDIMWKHSANQFIDQASRTDVHSLNITLLNRPLG